MESDVQITRWDPSGKPGIQKMSLHGILEQAETQHKFPSQENFGEF